MHGKREEECKTQPEGAVAVEPEKQVPEQHSRSEEAVQEVPAQAEQDTAKPEAAKKSLKPLKKSLKRFTMPPQRKRSRQSA